MARPPSPCYLCPLHRPGCHDPETCKDWKEYQAQQDASNKKRKAILQVESLLTSYKKERYRFARNRRPSNAK